MIKDIGLLGMLIVLASTGLAIYNENEPGKKKEFETKVIMISFMIFARLYLVNDLIALTKP